MSSFNEQYNDLIADIMNTGVWDYGEKVRTRWESDNTIAYSQSIISRQFRFDNSEIPILTNKYVAWKTAIKELLWIWQMKSNIVQDLRNMGVNIWNQWEQKDGTIGKAYGYQLAKKNRIRVNTRISMGSAFASWEKLDQVDYLLWQLKANPSSRRHITMLWNPDELDDMSLTPCVYETQWYVKQNKLHLEVRARSNDMGLGNPFNVFQYNVLQRMFAQVLGYELGEFIFNMGDTHIYERHVDTLKEQINNPYFDTPAPKLWINPDVKNFYDFTIDDFKIEDWYNNKNLPVYNFEVAI